MNHNVYLPDDLGARAKAAELPLSQLLRIAVIDELGRRKAMKSALNEKIENHEVELEDHEGRYYTGRITGALITTDGDAEVFLTDDERVIVYVHPRYWVLDDPESQLREYLDDAAYFDALTTLGYKPVVDL